MPNDTSYQLETQVINSKRIKDAAKRYAAAGLRVMPVTGKKAYLRHWQHLGIPTPESIQQWSNLDNVAIISGDGLAIVEIDGDQARELFYERFPQYRQQTFIVLSGSGQGDHVYLRSLAPLPRTTTNIKLPGEHQEIRLKVDGQYCVAPPSIHPETGQPYRVKVSRPILEVESVQPIFDWIESLKPDPPAVKGKHVTPSPKNGRRKLSSQSYTPSYDHLTRYYARILDEETAAIANAPDGAGNDIVFRSCLKIFDAVKSGGISEAQARAEINHALSGWTYRKQSDQQAMMRTIESAWERSAPGMNGRNPHAVEPRRPFSPAAPKIAPKVENCENVEKQRDWLTLPDAILSSILRCYGKVAPLFYIIAESRLGTFTREQAKAVALARGMTKTTFDHNWKALFSAPLQLLECIDSHNPEHTHSKSCNECHLKPCKEVIKQLLTLEEKRIISESHPIGAPPKWGEEDHRVVALQTAAMVRDSGIEENIDAIATELNAALQPVFDAQTHAECKAGQEATRELRRIVDSFKDPHQTRIARDASVHTLADLRAAYANGYASEHAGEVIARATWRCVLGCSNSGLKAILARANLSGKNPDDSTVLAIRSAADIKQITAYGRTVKGFPVMICYMTPDGREFEQHIDARNNAEGMQKICERALQSGKVEIEVVYQTAKEYPVQGAPLPTKKRDTQARTESKPLKQPAVTKRPSASVKRDHSDPRKYSLRWLRGQYQLALERMGWARVERGACVVDLETGEHAPDHPRELIELILSLSNKSDDVNASHERKLTAYELSARDDFRMQKIGEGWKLTQRQKPNLFAPLAHNPVHPLQVLNA